VAKFLAEKFPDVQVTGDVYPMSPLIIFILQLLSVVQLLAIAWMIVGGDTLLRTLKLVRPNQPLPAWYHTVQENGVPLAIFVFLLAPSMVQNLGNTKGAFEIYLNDTIMYSKLRTGKLPTIEDLTEPLVNAGLTMLVQKSE
jgi:thioredoxin reductase-like selenoprotein T